MTLTLPQLGSDLLTNSRLSCARTCLRKHQLRYEYGWRPRHEGTALRLGSAVHRGIEQLALRQPLAIAVAAACDPYAEIPAWCDNDNDKLDEWMTERETVAAMIAGYAWRWGEDGIEYISAECSFEMPIRNPDTGAASTIWKLGGKIDGIVRLPDGRTAIIEHKTTGDQIEPESDYWRRLRIDSQISTYHLGARSLGHEPDTVLYDVLRKPGIKPRKLTKAESSIFVPTRQWFGVEITDAAASPERESPQMFGARLLADMGERPDFYFARREIPRLDSDLAEFAQELWDQAADMRERRRSGRWYRNSNACVGFGRCEFLDVCADGRDAADGVPAGFVRVDNLHPELENR